MKIGNIVKYNNYEWYITKINNESVTLMMADVLSDDDINKLFDDKTYVDGNDVVYSKNNDNDWANTYIRKVLNSKFLDKFKKEELNVMRTNYSEDKYINDYVRIPTVWEIKSLFQKIVRNDYPYWTMTMSPDSRYSDCEWCIDYDGDFVAEGVANAFAILPVISLDSEIAEDNLVPKLSPQKDLNRRLNELEDRVRKLEAGND